MPSAGSRKNEAPHSAGKSSSTVPPCDETKPRQRSPPRGVRAGDLSRCMCLWHACDSYVNVCREKLLPLIERFGSSLDTGIGGSRCRQANRRRATPASPLSGDGRAARSNQRLVSISDREREGAPDCSHRTAHRSRDTNAPRRDPRAFATRPNGPTLPGELAGHVPPGPHQRGLRGRSRRQPGRLLATAASAATPAHVVG